MDNNCLISICIPAYNASKFIAETLESVKNQSYINWELVVVEDGSLDGTREIVEGFAAQVIQQVSYIRNEVNIGLPATRNVAANASKGSWIAFLDSDDLWHEDHLSELISTTINNPDWELIHSGVELFESETGKVTSIRVPDLRAIKDFPLSLFNGTYPVQPSSVMLSRTLFELTGGFREDLKYVEDLEMWIRCAREGVKFAFTGKNTCLYRQHISGAMTNNVIAMTLAFAKVYDIHSDWDFIPKVVRVKRASEHWFAAARILRTSNKRLAQSCLSKSMNYNITLKHLLLWFLVKIF